MKFQRRFFLLAIFALAIVFYLVIYSSSDFPFSNQSDSKATSQNSISKVPSILFDEKLWKKFVNNNGTVWNQDKFLSKFINSSMVIVVQVHQRIENLRALIDSMRKVRFIDESLIVFSHDYYDDSINNVIRTIDFTQVTQIFFPFSTQVWINTFPGTSYNDCKRDMTRKKAIEVDCINSKYPDTYGHYRESAITQTKHHWWWKANYVLDQLPITKNHPGIFVFIEEDHYILPDFIHSWKLMQDVKRSLNKQNERVDIFTFGNYDKISKVATNSNGIMYTEWFSSKHNMAFSIDRDLWTKLKLCSAVFCTYDDYNWDWTMQHIMQNCFDDPPFTLVPIIPRVMHIGTCGIHHKKSDCSIDGKIQNIKDMINSGLYFPKTFQLTRKMKTKKPKLKNNGGWSDPRDHQLCLQYELPLKDIISGSNPNFNSFNLLNLLNY